MPPGVRPGRAASGGCGGAGSAARSGLSANGSPATRRRARFCRIASTWLRIESIVPPLNPPRMVATRRDVPQAARPVGGRALVQQQGREVGRDGVVAAGVHDPRPGLASRRVAAVDRLAGEQDLPGEVGVVGARRGAGLDDGQPVARVGAHRRHEHAGRAGERGERTGVLRVRVDQRPLPRRHRKGGADAPRACPSTGRRARPGRLRRSVLGQVLGDQPPDEPGGAVEDEVVFTGWVRHAPILHAHPDSRALSPRLAAPPGLETRNGSCSP